jgi:toxin CptA
VNTWIVLDLVMALLGKLGVVDPDAPNIGARIGVAALIMLIQVTIAWFGYRVIAAFERWTVPVTLVVLVAMSAVAWFHLHINWSYAGPPGHILTGTARVAAMTGVMTAIGIGWGITWFTYAADYSRFVSRDVPRRKLYLASVLGQFLPTVWLGVLGASLATTSGQIDPGKLIVDSYGALALPVLFLVIHGPIATNILNVYTFGVAIQAMDVKMNRRTLSVLVGVLAFLAVIFFVYQSDLASVLDTFLSGIVAWIATWGSIMLVHYYWLERDSSAIDRLFDPVKTRRLPDINWSTMVAFLAGVVATWAFMYGATPALQGPGAVALGGIDLSWLAGAVVAGAVYALLARKAHLRYAESGRNGLGNVPNKATRNKPAAAG